MLKSSRRRDWLLGDFMKLSAELWALRRKKWASVPTYSEHLQWGKQPPGHQSFLLTVSICHRQCLRESKDLSLIPILHQCSPNSTPSDTCCLSGTCPYTAHSLWYIIPPPFLLSMSEGDSTHLSQLSFTHSPFPLTGTHRILPTTRVLHVARWWWVKEQTNKNGDAGEGKLWLKANRKLPLPLPLSPAELTLHMVRICFPTL